MKTKSFIKSNFLRNKFFNQQDELTNIARKNVLYSVIFRGLGMFFNLLLVPLTLDYFTPLNYGIWLTLSSFLYWLILFDFGISGAFRNKYAEALATKNWDAAKIYVSTSYFTISCIAVLLAGVCYLALHTVNWISLFNYPAALYNELLTLFSILSLLFCLRLIFGLINTVYSANNKFSLSSLLEFSTTLLVLLTIVVLKQFSYNSLFLAGLLYGLILVIVPLVANVWSFTGAYRAYYPRWRFVDVQSSGNLLKLSSHFFFLQLSLLLLYFGSNFIISALLGPEDVTVFNIPYKFLSIPITLSILIYNPYLSAATFAYNNGDTAWFKKTSKHLLFVWLGLSFLTVVFVIVSPLIFTIWISNKIIVPLSVTMLIGVFVIVHMWNNLFGYLLFGVGKIRVQLYSYLIGAFLIIPLSYMSTSTFKSGLEGIIIANIVCLLPCSVALPIQLNKIINNTAIGLFSK
ncbi:hypothetical protein FVR03_23300 [Pontibacter qinzhouensis]|uniref:Oligosaccharide flippase family protein n=1 Tax=Pontibacter qinzhouensis TaxID=2603253 RepID=A0A5C8IJH2_9BACT|nr:hypothetical protein [Pontibacter qinzhouensis]TXK21618.1 hypothetical protein FVR03_23300 [Pontibacter qinzhouensis]